MALRYPGLPVRVQTGLLGRYDPSIKRQNQMAWQGGGQGGFGGGGFNPGSFGSGGGFQPPELSELSAKYLKGIPEANIETSQQNLYESNIGGFRQDVEGAITGAGQQAIGQAAQSGREVSDVMARYLPEAIKGFARGAADVTGQSSKLAQQGQVAKSELDLKRHGMANEMARFDQAAQQQQYQFMAQLQTQYQMNREKMANNLRVAQASASNQREIQAINNAHQMQMQQMNNQFKMQASQYAESQQNARQSYQLRTYAEMQKRGQNIQGFKASQDYWSPDFTPGGSQDNYQSGADSPQLGVSNAGGWDYTKGVNFRGNPQDIYKQMQQRNQYYRDQSSGSYGYFD